MVSLHPDPLLLLHHFLGLYLVTQVRNRQDAQEAVDAVRYAPVGRRGSYGSSRATGFGAVDWEEHVRTSNEEILLTLLVEDLEGLENLEEIASVEGVDIVNVGPHDMAMALGVTDPNDPRLRKTVEQAAERLRKVGKARFGFSIGHHWCPVTVAEARGMGVVYSNAGPPVGALLLNSYRKHVDSLRQDGA